MKQFLALVVVVALALPAIAADVFGTWKLDLVNKYGGTITILVTFKQDGNKLIGTCTGEELGDMTATGETNGNQLTWRCESDEHGEKQVGVFTGTLNQSGSEMKGKWTTVINGTFTGSRQHP